MAPVQKCLAIIAGFVECCSVLAMGDGRIMELERSSLLLAVRFGHQYWHLLVAVVVLKQTTINSYERGNNNNNVSMAVEAANNNQQLW